MNLRQLGLLMYNWHYNQWDPIYMVGFYFSCGKEYPDKEIIQEAISNLKSYMKTSVAKNRSELRVIISELNKIVSRN